MALGLAVAISGYGCDSSGGGEAGAGGTSGSDPAGGAGGSSGASGGVGAGGAGTGGVGGDVDAGPWEDPAASFCIPDGRTVLAALPSLQDYAVVDDELYVLSSNEQGGSASAVLEVSPAGGGPGTTILQDDRYAFGLEADAEFAYVITRPTDLVGTGETYEDWRVVRLDLGTLEQATLATGNLYVFSLGEAGVFVYELEPPQLVLYTRDRKRRPVCATPVRAPRHRDRPDRRIVITQIAAS